MTGLQRSASPRPSATTPAVRAGTNASNPFAEYSAALGGKSARSAVNVPPYSAADGAAGVKSAGSLAPNAALPATARGGGKADGKAAGGIAPLQISASAAGVGSTASRWETCFWAHSAWCTLPETISRCTCFASAVSKQVLPALQVAAAGARQPDRQPGAGREADLVVQLVPQEVQLAVDHTRRNRQRLHSTVGDSARICLCCDVHMTASRCTSHVPGRRWQRLHSEVPSQHPGLGSGGSGAAQAAPTSASTDYRTKSAAYIACAWLLLWLLSGPTQGCLSILPFLHPYMLRRVRQQLARVCCAAVQVSAGPQAPNRRQAGVADAVRHRVGTEQRQQRPHKAAVRRRRPQVRLGGRRADGNSRRWHTDDGDHAVAPAGDPLAAPTPAAAAVSRLRDFVGSCVVCTHEVTGVLYCNLGLECWRQLLCSVSVHTNGSDQ